MPINVMVEPFTATGAAQRQENILAEKAPCFYGSAAIVCVGCLVVQRACTTQQFCGLESGGAAMLVLLRFEGAPTTFTSAQPLNSKRYDPFFEGNQRTIQCVLSANQRRNQIYIYFAIHRKLFGVLSFCAMQMQQDCFFIRRNQ